MASDFAPKDFTSINSHEDELFFKQRRLTLFADPGSLDFLDYANAILDCKKDQSRHFPSKYADRELRFKIYSPHRRDYVRTSETGLLVCGTLELILLEGRVASRVQSSKPRLRTMRADLCLRLPDGLTSGPCTVYFEEIKYPNLGNTLRANDLSVRHLMTPRGDRQRAGFRTYGAGTVISD